jgi:cell wall-associated protease
VSITAGKIAETVTTTTDDSGFYRFEGLAGGDPHTIEFVDPSGLRSRVAYPQSGFKIEDADRFVPDSISFNVDAYLPTQKESLQRLANRIAGEDRYATSIAISRANFPAADTVVLVTGANFPDALAASPLAGLYNAPLLLTSPKRVPDGLIAEMKRLANGAGLSAPKVVIVGGTASVSKRVVDQLKAAGIKDVTRIAGANRYEVAAKVAEIVQRNSPNKEPFLCRGDVFADALAVAPFAYMERRPILLTPTSGFKSKSHPTHVAWKKMRGEADDFIMLVGGPSSMTGHVADSIVAISGKRFYDRDGDPNTVDPSNVWLYGADRYATAEAVISFYKDDFWKLSGGWDGFGVASGTSFADALAGGAACGRQGIPLVLTSKSSLSAPAQRVLSGSGANVINIEVFGGRSALSGSVMSSAKSTVVTAQGR